MERTCIAGTGGGLRRRAKARVRVVDTRPREGRGPVIVSAYIKSSTTRSSLQVAVDGLSGALTSPGQPLKIRVFFCHTGRTSPPTFRKTAADV